MKVREAAIRLEISPSLVYQLIACGRLRCTRHGMGRGTVRISEEQLAEYLAAAEWSEPPPLPPDAKGGAFRHLNAAKLRRAWRQE